MKSVNDKNRRKNPQMFTRYGGVLRILLCFSHHSDVLGSSPLFTGLDGSMHFEFCYLVRGRKGRYFWTEL